MEVLGGNGYIEENLLPRLYREAPVNSIWEGAGNIVALDVGRAVRTEPEAIEALTADLALARGANAHFDRHIAALDPALRRAPEEPGAARRVAQAVACAVCAAEMIRHAPPFVADAYCESRLAESAFSGAALGTLPAAADTRQILARALA